MARYGELGIGKITVATAKLIGIVTENRAKHEATYHEAVQKFRVLAVEALHQRANDVAEGKYPKQRGRYGDEVFSFPDLPVPQQYLSNYDMALRMLDLHTETTIDLDENAVEQLVNDVWGWHGEFVANTAYYNGGGA